MDRLWYSNYTLIAAEGPAFMGFMDRLWYSNYTLIAAEGPAFMGFMDRLWYSNYTPIAAEVPEGRPKIAHGFSRGICRKAI